MVEVVDSKTSVKNSEREAEFVVEKKITIKVEDEVDLSPVAEVVAEAVAKEEDGTPQLSNRNNEKDPLTKLLASAAH